MERAARFCRVPNPCPQPSQLTDWAMAITPDPCSALQDPSLTLWQLLLPFLSLCSGESSSDWWIAVAALGGQSKSKDAHAAFPSLLSSSRTWAEMKCPSPSTWKPPGWFSKCFETMKEVYWGARCWNTSWSKNIPFHLLPVPPWPVVQHLSFLTIYGMSSRTCIQQKRGSSKARQFLLPQSEMAWL